MKFKQLILILSLISSPIFLNAQAREETSGRPSPTKVKKGFNGFDLENVVVGGNVGAQFGTITVINLNPTVGYKFRESWLVGVSGTYLFYEDKRYTPAFSTSIYGGSVFSQYYFLEYFTAHVEYEVLNLEAFNVPERINVDAFLVGGGFRSALGSNSFVNFLLLYNLLEDVNYPYQNPIFRVGFGIGL